MIRLRLNDPLVRWCWLCVSIVFFSATSVSSYGWSVIVWYEVNLSLLLDAIVFPRSQLLAAPSNQSDVLSCLKGCSGSISEVLNDLNGILSNLSDVWVCLWSRSYCINKEMIYQYVFLDSFRGIECFLKAR